MNKEEDKSIVYKINDYFKMPIYYNNEKVELNQNIINDLELINTFDPSGNSIYSFYFNNDNDISKKIIEQITKYYTTDIKFLKENQKLITEYVAPQTKYTKTSSNYKNIIDIWNELKIETGFREKYCYVDFEMIEFLNTSELFLQFISIYNLFSPIIALIVPIIILVIPFFILKLKSLPITLNEYIDVLKVVAKTNAIGKLFTVNFTEITTHEKYTYLFQLHFIYFQFIKI